LQSELSFVSETFEPDPKADSKLWRREMNRCLEIRNRSIALSFGEYQKISLEF